MEPTARPLRAGKWNRPADFLLTSTPYASDHEALLYRGELTRSDVAAIAGTGDRQARRITSALLDNGVLTSLSPRDPLHLAFPAALASRWLPGLFPDRVE